MFEEYPDVVTVNLLMKMLNIGKSSAYELLKNNQIGSVRIGKKYVIPKKAVINLFDGICYNDSQIISGRLHEVMEGDIV